MKKLITVLSLAVVFSFVITACIQLIPRKSREGISSSSTPTPLFTETSSPVVPPNENDTATYPPYSLNGETHNESVNVNGVKIGTISFFIPMVSYDEDPQIANKINTVLAEKSKEHINNYREECNFLAMDFDPQEMSPYQYLSTASLYVSQTTVTVKIVTDINYGSVLREKTVFCYNFSAITGEEISIEDIDIDRSKLSDAIIEKSLTMTELEFTSNYQKYIKENLCNSWYIDGKIIHLIYVPLEITSEINGIVEITVDLDSLI